MVRIAPRAIEQFPAPGTCPPEAAAVLRLRKVADFADPVLLERWDALAAQAAEPNPFAESWFLLPSLHALDPQGKVDLVCLDHGDALIGIMPIRRLSSYYGYPLPHLRNWVHDNAFCGQPLVAAGMEAVFWRELLAWCDATAGSALFLHLVHMPQGGVLHSALQGLLQGEARAAATVHTEERTMLASPLSPDAYLEQSLTGKKRKELRRQQRRLAELGKVEVQRLHDPAPVAAWAERFMALEQAGWKGQARSALASDPANARWFREALAGAAARGRVECLSLLLDGREIAMLASFLTAPGAYSFKTAFDEDFARFSPGVLLQCENLAMLDRADIAWTDSCAAPDHLMIDHIWRERRRIARHSIAVGGPARQRLFGLLAKHETGQVPGGIA